MFDRNAYNKRVEWFKKDRFGMFIHWGLYAIPARGEWIRSVEKITVEDYQQFYDEFDPVDYEPKVWAKAAKKAGMKYAVLTAKHHDGFCLFDSKLTDYKCTNTKAGRDLVAEYLEAFRAEGIKVGLYYSLIDWHHEGFPHYGDRQHPMRDNEEYKGKEHDFDSYLKYMHGQVEELCTNYGKIDVMWFDFSYDDMSCEKWEATKLVKMIRSHQPDVILDNRLEVSGSGFGSLATKNPSEYCGDFVSPEQIIPPNPLFNEEGDELVWEACITMNNNWGYCSSDHNFKRSDDLIRKLVECVSKSGNLLLNVGPDAKGNIPSESLKILSDIGDWMDKNKDSIYNCSRSEIKKPDNGRLTQNGKTIYYHVLENSIGGIPLYGIEREKVKSLRLLSDKSELKPLKSWITDNYPDTTFVGFGETPNLPCYTDTVIEIKLK